MSLTNFFFTVHDVHCTVHVTILFIIILKNKCFQEGGLGAEQSSSAGTTGHTKETHGNSSGMFN
jgi:hypothetical protein